MIPDTSTGNVVLITADSLRADAVGSASDGHYTPVLDGLADRGTTFERAFATGNWTPFSFPSILASRPVFADTGRIGVSESQTLAETLSAAGVATGGFNAANGFLTSHWGYDKGFDEFEPFVAEVGSNVYSQYLATHPTVEAWLQLAAAPFRRAHSMIRGAGDDRPFLDTSRLFDVERAASSFIEGTEEPFFLWLHYMDAHTPYAPAPRYIREVSADLLGTHRMLLAHTRTGLGLEVGERTLADLWTLYRGAVRQVDASIGRVLEALSATGVGEETAVIVAGDHGEEFQEHGHLAHYPKLYDELIRVPLIVDVPDAEPWRISGAVSLDAIPPTVCDLLGVDPPATWRGDSLRSSVLGGTSPMEEPVLSVTVRGEEVTSQPIPRGLDDGDLLVSARTREWTYIENTATGAHELYHRSTDPTEHDDRAGEPTAARTRVLSRLQSAIDEHTALLEGVDSENDSEEVDDAVETRLSALGYR